MKKATFVTDLLTFTETNSLIYLMVVVKVKIYYIVGKLADTLLAQNFKIVIHGMLVQLQKHVLFFASLE